MGFYFNQQLVGSYFNQPQNISESVHAEMNNIYVICYIFILYNSHFYFHLFIIIIIIIIYLLIKLI